MTAVLNVLSPVLRDLDALAISLLVIESHNISTRDMLCMSRRNNGCLFS